MGVKFAGHDLKLTIGALEEIDETNALATVAHVISNGLWKAGEVVAVLAAAYRASGVFKGEDETENIAQLHRDMEAAGMTVSHQASFDLLEGVFAAAGKKPARRRAKKTPSQ